MYLLLLVTLLAAGLLLMLTGSGAQRRDFVWIGRTLIAATLGFFALMSLWGEALWFYALGYESRFWTLLTVQGASILGGGAFGLAGVYLLSIAARRCRSEISPWAELVGGAGGAVLGLNAWQPVLLFLHRVEAGITEPILDLDVSFYLFALPLLESLHNLMIWIGAVTVVTTFVVLLLPDREGSRLFDDDGAAGKGAHPLAIASLAMGIVIALDALLGVFRLLYSDLGIVTGPGWTDVHVRLPGSLALAALTLAIAALPLFSAPQHWLGAAVGRFAPGLRSTAVRAVGGAWVGIFVTWLMVGDLLPAAFQWLLVEPNEITYERPYIANNIRMTRHGFRLHEIEERQFPANESITPQLLETNQNLISEIRLWDWRALDAVYKQFQEIRLYYEFDDVDIDRYSIDGRYRQVMVSAREMAQSNLPESSQTFVNARFKYTHGYGLTLATVSDFTPEGLPNLLVKDIPPQSRYESLEVERPEIYFGELTSAPVVVNSTEQEFDYPSGERNVYTRYQGTGGVQLDSFWRKLLFGWKFDGTQFLFSGYPTAESRVLFHRRIRDRLRILAPFLTYDRDPYIVLSEGRLHWIVDAYTQSDHYPYSEAFSAPEFGVAALQPQVDTAGEAFVGDFDGANYLRNSVKVVIDAYNGDVDFYVYESDDPIVSTWRKALPGLFKDRADMPEALRAHVRYPQDFLLTQGLVYAKYHMGDPEVFYNQEDLWVRATEKHYGRVQPVEPYYVMWALPGSDHAEFVLMLPFTPKNRQVLIGWIAGLSDGDNYGRFFAYKFPKEQRVLGPQQVETKIDQDSYLSGQLTLWDQRGSDVIRGNVLAIPVDDVLLYVEPIYLKAETAAYPELRLVVVMHGDNMSYAETFDDALAGLFDDQARRADGGDQLGAPAGATMKQLARQAQDAFEDYLQAQSERRFNAAAQAMDRLSTTLERMTTAARD